MGDTEDFSQGIAGLVNAIMAALQNEGLVYVGELQDFSVFTSNMRVLLTSPNLSYSDVRKLPTYLAENGWTQDIILGIAVFPANGSDKPLSGLSHPYIAVDVITQEKKELCSQISKLSRLLENYRNIPA